VARDTDAAGVELWEGFKDRRGEFLRHVRVHVVALVVGLGGCVDVEAGPCAEVPTVVFAGDVEAPCLR
jgi:UDP-N-acetyl-D-mannosaminuronic acid transferase (WecB/TagA/CpsF family)